MKNTTNKLELIKMLCEIIIQVCDFFLGKNTGKKNNSTEEAEIINEENIQEE